MALFLLVAELAETLAGEPSRLKKRAAIAAAIGGSALESIEDAGLLATYVAGMPFAEADPRKLNAGGALLSKALLAVSGASDAELGTAYRRMEIGELQLLICGRLRVRDYRWGGG